VVSIIRTTELKFWRSETRRGWACGWLNRSPACLFVFPDSTEEGKITNRANFVPPSRSRLEHYLIERSYSHYANFQKRTNPRSGNFVSRWRYKTRKFCPVYPPPRKFDDAYSSVNFRQLFWQWSLWSGNRTCRSRESPLFSNDSPLKSFWKKFSLHLLTGFCSPFTLSRLLFVFRRHFDRNNKASYVWILIDLSMHCFDSSLLIVTAPSNYWTFLVEYDLVWSQIGVILFSHVPWEGNQTQSLLPFAVSNKWHLRSVTRDKAKPKKRPGYSSFCTRGRKLLEIEWCVPIFWWVTEITSRGKRNRVDEWP